MHEPSTSSPKILLVDDREDNLLSIEAILRKDGYDFAMAFSGAQALKILSNDPDFAMILMDVKMPTMSGFETATLIYEREKLKHIPIIFITANYYGEENLFKGYKSGGIDYIFKPINPEVLRAKVSVFIDLYRKNRLLIEQDKKLLEINKNLAFEIAHLRATEQRLTAINRTLRKKVAQLEAIMAISEINIRHSDFQNSDMNVLLHSLLQDMADEIKNATISVEKLPTLFISPKLMKPLFKNLISNTLQYQQRIINPMVRIYSDTEDVNLGEQRYCRIVVEDAGNAMFDNKESDINDEFLYDTEHGLPFYQKIMEHHKGFISARNKVNQGLAYILSLPLERRDSIM